jgi:fructose-1,6-bisphosphatase II
VPDAIDGCALLAQGYPGAISVVAAAPCGSFWAPVPAHYMDKMVVDAMVGSALVPECLDAPAAWTLALVARAKGKNVSDLVVFILDRPRHADLVAEIRAAGARTMLREEGDIAGALMAVLTDGGVDILMGIGGVTEGLIAACAVKASDGAMLGRLAPQSARERSEVEAAGLDLHRILAVDELVSSNEVFFVATGITDGPLLSGVAYHGTLATSNSMILRGQTRTRRVIQAEHRLEKT